MKTGVLKWVWCLGLAVGLPSCSGVEEQEVVSPDRHLVVGMTELDKDEYGDVSVRFWQLLCWRSGWGSYWWCCWAVRCWKECSLL